MLPDTVNGLPVHPLSVHATVVLVPLAALLGVLFAVPRLRRWAQLPLALVGLAAAGSVWVSIESGDALLRAGGIGAAGLGGPVADLVDRHAELANQLRWMVWAYAAVALLAVAVGWRTRPVEPRADGRAGERGRRRGGVLVAVLSAVLVLGAVALGVQTYRVGDIGSEALWNPAGTTDYSAED